MRKKKPDPEKIDKENPEWTDAMFAKAKPASEVFPDIDLGDASGVAQGDVFARVRKAANLPEKK